MSPEAQKVASDGHQGGIGKWSIGKWAACRYRAAIQSPNDKVSPHGN